jgi:wyosine [tRNA(Phe)-imidazoG37] synthetase (radical SAM superfamily)
METPPPEVAPMKCIFGPVPSRRLGRSLGIDVIAPKTCTFDCLYCESGRTTVLSLQRQQFVEIDEVLRELDAYFREYPQGADVLTFSSAGEPTLYLGLGALLEAIKARFRDLPVVVLTNGSLLWDPQIRRELCLADRVVPSLDAVDAHIFARLNRPHADLDIEAIVDGLRGFRRDYRGEFHLEIMLVAGINDDEEHLKTLARVAETLRPDRIELNTIVRPPAYPGVCGLGPQPMEKAAHLFSRERTEIIGNFNAIVEEDQKRDLSGRIEELLRRRPCTAEEMAVSLAVSHRAVEIELRALEQCGVLEVNLFGGRRFFRLAERHPS